MRRRGACVAASGSKATRWTAMRLNLESRLAQRVLIEPWPTGLYRDEHDLYTLAREVDWAHWITPRQTLRVDTTAQRSPLQQPELRHAAHQGRRMRRAARRDRRAPERRHAPPRPAARAAPRPGPRHAVCRHLWRAAVQARLARAEAKGRGAAEGNTGCGDAGRRRLAAARAEAGGALHDPCCGAGTIAIEAAQIACGIAPGLLRRFAFERLAAVRARRGARRGWR